MKDISAQPQEEEAPEPADTLPMVDSLALESVLDKQAPHLHDGHRNRLRQRFLATDAAGLHDYELLEVVLFSAIPRRDVKPLAKQLISHFGSLAGVLGASANDLRKVKGISDNTIVLLRAVHIMGQRMLRQEIAQKPVLNSWKKLVDYCHIAMAQEKREQFRVLFLNRKNQLIADEVQQVGTVDHTPVYPREIIRRTLELGATALILVHNHPSGDPTPSDSDLALTEEIIKAAFALGILVHDHLIIGKEGHTSMKSLGLLDFTG